MQFVISRQCDPNADKTTTDGLRRVVFGDGDTLIAEDVTVIWLKKQHSE